MQYVIKRDGREVEFDASKIKEAIEGANREMTVPMTLSEAKVDECVSRVVRECQKRNYAISVEDIQDIVETVLIRHGNPEIAKRYIRYRYEREMRRKHNTIDDAVLAIVQYESESVKQENSNKNPEIIPTQRDYIAGEVSKDIVKRMMLPADIVEAHENGIIHFHDADYFIQKSINCCLVNLEDMLQNGTVISGTMIEKPHMFSTACNIATQIVAQVASCQYGGQTITLAHLAPFVNATRTRFRERYKELLQNLSEQEFNAFIEKLVREDIIRGIQTIQYQLITLQTTNGQAPFITVYCDINEVPEGQTRDDLAIVIEEVLKQRYEGVKNSEGVYITPAFPKLIYALDDNNVTEDGKYWYLTKLAAKCTAKRLVPDYISKKMMRQLKVNRLGHGDTYPCMGCRSFLTPYVDPKTEEPKYYGRFNQGVVTINLVDVALSSGGDMDEFWKIMNERLDLCHRALRIRHEHLKGTTSDVAPIHWQYGALARLQKGEKIDPLLYNGYSTISLGYAGLYECVKYMTGEFHTDPEKGYPFGIKVMQALNDATAKWKAEEHIDYSVYGTPIESTTYKFAKCLQNRFGIIPEVTDHNYITNSYHICVREPIDAFKKLALEADFQKLSPGGAISYVEVPNLQDNLEAVLAVIQFIYDHIMYAELNTKSDYCQVCGYDGEIKIVKDESGKLVWECPNCHNRDQHKMNVARRTCGRPNSYSHIKAVEIQGNSLQQDNPEPSRLIYSFYDTEHMDNYRFECEICHRKLKRKTVSYGHIYCPKHYKQIKKYGHPLDNNPRTIYDRNEFRIKGNVTEIDLYDERCNVIATALIDTEDLPRVRYTKWKLSSSGYVMNTPKFSGSNKHLSRTIMQTDQFVDHINHNPLDNRKCNLRIVTKSQNQMNVNYKGVSQTKDGRYYAHIKLNNKLINLGVYVDEEEAYFARWYAETLLFKDYRYPKEMPVIPSMRENEIKEYVDRKVQRL